MKIVIATIACLLVLASPSFAAKEAPAPNDKKQGESDPEAEVQPVWVGYEIGDFTIKDVRPAEGAKTRLSFTLHAAVIDEELPKFKKLASARTARIRDQVITSIRLSEPTAYQEADLGHLRRRILLRLRRALPELKIEEMLLSEWHYVVE